MKLYGFFVLSFLILTIGANYQEDDDELQEEMNNVRRRVNNYDTVNKRFRLPNKNSHSASELSPDAKRDAVVGKTSPTTLEEPVRISVFNSGDFDAYIKLNYILNNRQDEQELTIPIINRHERDFQLPHSANHIRIRITVIGDVIAQDIIDEQLLNFDNIKEKCYLLAGTRTHPVYGLCPFPYSQYYKIWKSKR